MPYSAMLAYSLSSWALFTNLAWCVAFIFIVAAMAAFYSCAWFRVAPPKRWLQQDGSDEKQPDLQQELKVAVIFGSVAFVLSLRPLITDFFSWLRGTDGLRESVWFREVQWLFELSTLVLSLVVTYWLAQRWLRWRRGQRSNAQEEAQGAEATSRGSWWWWHWLRVRPIWFAEFLLRVTDGCATRLAWFVGWRCMRRWRWRMWTGISLLAISW